MTKVRNFITEHADFFTFWGLCLILYFIFFHNNWAYALMDVDESRYVTMSKDMFESKDFITLYLNKEYFFEKPPLFFWLECLSFGLFGRITEAVARFPVALFGSLTVFFTYYIGKRLVSRSYGVISALILATSIEFVILAKFAILDIILASCIWMSLCFGIMTQFCQEKHEKYYWWAFYAFSGLAVMAKGIPGFIIPFGSMFFITLYSKRFKSVFKPQFMLPGIIIFLLITLPWHIIMLKMYGSLFFNEYIIKHHLARFLGSSVINRKEPWYYYFITLCWGFLPWIISVVSVLIRKILKRDLKLTELTIFRRFVLYNGIIFLFTLLFFTVSGTKLITYILPLYPSLACLSGYIWTNYVERGEYSIVINKTVYVIGGIFTFAGIAAMFTQYYLPSQLNSDISSAKPLCIILLLFMGIGSIIFTRKRQYIGTFFVYVIFMACLSAFGTEKLFEVDYKFGQNELMRYAQYADEHNKSITCYQFDQKYSLIFYSNESVEYGDSYKINDLRRELNTPNNLVIIQRKDVSKQIAKLPFKIIYKGRKYWLIEKK